MLEIYIQTGMGIVEMAMLLVFQQTDNKQTQSAK
jgi:hypothetical protein